MTPERLDKLVAPSEKDTLTDVREIAELMLEESVEVVRAINANEEYPRPSFLGQEYDFAYACGRKDACRVLLLRIDPGHQGPRSTDAVTT